MKAIMTFAELKRNEIAMCSELLERADWALGESEGLPKVVKKLPTIFQVWMIGANGAATTYQNWLGGWIWGAVCSTTGKAGRPSKAESK